MWPIPQECVDLVTFTEKTFMEKLNFVFLCSERHKKQKQLIMSALKNSYSKRFAKFTSKKTWDGTLILEKMLVCWPSKLLKTDTIASAFLWILWIFWDEFHSSNCFCRKTSWLSWTMRQWGLIILIRTYLPVVYDEVFLRKLLTTTVKVSKIE